MPESDFLLPFPKPGNSSYTGRIREICRRLDFIFFSINTKILSVTASSDVCSQILIWPAYFVVLIKNIPKTQHPHLPSQHTGSATLDSTQKLTLYIIFQNALASFHNVHIHSHHHFQMGHNRGSQGLSPWPLAKSRYQQPAPHLFGRAGRRKPAFIPIPPTVHAITVQFPTLQHISSLMFQARNGGGVRDSVFILLNHLYLIGKTGSCNSVNRTCSIT